MEDHQLTTKKNTLISTFFDEKITEDQSSNLPHLSIQPSPTPASASYPFLLYCCISSLCHDDGAINSIAVSGNLVLTGSSTTRIHAWQSLDCHAKGYIKTTSGDVRAMVSHGDLLFTSHKDHKVRMWNMKNPRGDFEPRKVTTLPNNITGHFKNYPFRKHAIALQHKDTISCMAFNHVEGLLYTGSFDRTIKVWKLNEKKCVDSIIAHRGNINDLVINQQNGYLFTCSSDGTVKMWLRAYGETLHTLIKVLNFNTCPVYALALSVSPSHRSILYSGPSDGCINFWAEENSFQYNHNGFLKGHHFGVLCLVTLEDLVISGSEDSTIRMWRREKGRVIHECLAVLEGHRGPVRCLAAYLPKDKAMMSFLVYSASLDRTFKVWRVRLLREVKKFTDNSSTREDGMESEGDPIGFEASPVISPSRVKKKLRYSNPQFFTS
ncbi:protein JINGUBANG-like [Chenopodium quinoa]|uniref:Uncharacterized protein n=1 Tax=Chenopodium quinoa TaxID=63459 RepID=A0A803N7F3_CHEQI|nr:protein JINGUBANG-like [Chenopodium quinoa]